MMRPLAEIYAGVGLILWSVGYFFLPRSVVPGLFSWQFVAYLGTMCVVQRKIAAGKQCSASSSLKGKITLVSGANTGIGYETALRFAQLGGKVYLACRSKQRAEDALAKIRAAVPGASVEFLHLDISDFDQVRKAVDDLSVRLGGEGIDILVCNAGIMDATGDLPQKLPNGHESHIGTNHLGTMLFTELCVPFVQKRKGRIVIVSSLANMISITWGKKGSGREKGAPGALFKLTMDNESFTKKVDFSTPYGISKAGNIIYAKHLAKRVASSGVRVAALHPGCVQTELVRSKVIQLAMIPLAPLFLKSARDGAQTSLHCSLAHGIVNGGFYADCALREDVVRADVLDPTSQKEFLDWSYQQLKLPKPRGQE